MMVRTQIQLEEEQYRRIQELARARGVSMSEIMRQGVEMALAHWDRRKKWERAKGLAGKFSSKESDVARRHDDYLAEAYGVKKK